jgi:hypothetical protein
MATGTMIPRVRPGSVRYKSGPTANVGAPVTMNQPSLAGTTGSYMAGRLFPASMGVEPRPS